MSTGIASKKLYSVVISYEKADVDVRSLFSIPTEKMGTLLQDVAKNGGAGALAISTCNRTELIGFVNHPYQLICLLSQHTQGDVETLMRYVTILEGSAVVHHLFRVATGLESQILGDYEIVGQFKKSLKIAREQRVLGSYLERLGNMAIQASKKVKNQTAISSGTTSVSYAAIQYLLDKLPDHQNKSILIYGLGKMGRHTCKNLRSYLDIKDITLINRTFEKAVDFAEQVPQIKVRPHKDLKSAIADADVLIVSTAAEMPTIVADDVPKDKELLILDLSMPQNVASSLKSRSGVHLVNVDQLSKITEQTLSKRLAEIPKAESIIAEYENQFNQWASALVFTPTINALKSAFRDIQEDEIDFQAKKINDFNTDHANLVTSRVIQKITTQIIKHLKTEDTTNIPDNLEMLSKMFLSENAVLAAKNRQ